MTDSVTECGMCGHRACTRGRGRQIDHDCPSCPNGTCRGYISDIRQRAAEPPPPPLPAWIPDEYRPDEPADPRWPSDPTPEWLEAWAAGWLAGYASGYEAGTDNGYAEYGADLAHAVSPLKRAAARGIDMMLARRAWENQRRAEHGMPPLTGPLDRGGDREPYPEGGGGA